MQSCEAQIPHKYEMLYSTSTAASSGSARLFRCTKYLAALACDLDKCLEVQAWARVESTT